MPDLHGVPRKLYIIIEIVFLAYKILVKISYRFGQNCLTQGVKNDENDQNAYVNIFQRTIDMIVIVFLGCSIPLGPLLTQISWL